MLEIKQSQLSHIVSRRTPDTENFLLFGERERESTNEPRGRTECQLLFGIPSLQKNDQRNPTDDQREKD